jgi:hypothetical protein
MRLLVSVRSRSITCCRKQLYFQPLIVEGSMNGDELKLRELIRAEVNRALVAHVEAGRPILIFSLVVTLLIALAIVVAGCALVYLGATGFTEMELFGNKVSTGSVGTVGIFGGTIVSVLNTRRSLKTLERLAAIKWVAS